MRKINPLLLAGFLISAGVYLMSRTKTGASVAEEVIEQVVSVVSQPRGIRNNNPGNIERTGTKWRGMSADQSKDSRFVVFDYPEWGIRAIARVIKTYMGRGVNTVQGIINTWAPPSENDTAAYIAAVARKIGVTPYQPLDAGALPGLVAAIIFHENGQQPYSADQIARGIELERTT